LAGDRIKEQAVDSDEGSLPVPNFTGDYMEPWKQFQTIRYFELGGDKMVFDSHFVGKLC